MSTEAEAWITFAIVVASLFTWCAIGEALL